MASTACWCNAGGEADSPGACPGLVHLRQGNATFRLANVGEAVDLARGAYSPERSRDACLELAARGPRPCQGSQCRRERGGIFPASPWPSPTRWMGKRLGDCACAPTPAAIGAYVQRAPADPATATPAPTTRRSAGWRSAWTVAGGASGGRWYAGGLLSYTYADRTYPGDGGGKVRACTSAATPAYVGDGGYYLETPWRLGRYDQQYNIAGTDGGRVTADYRTSGAMVARRRAPVRAAQRLVRRTAGRGHAVAHVKGAIAPAMACARQGGRQHRHAGPPGLALRPPHRSWPAATSCSPTPGSAGRRSSKARVMCAPMALAMPAQAATAAWNWARASTPRWARAQPLCFVRVRGGRPDQHSVVVPRRLPLQLLSELNEKPRQANLAGFSVKRRGKPRRFRPGRRD